MAMATTSQRSGRRLPALQRFKIRDCGNSLFDRGRLSAVAIRAAIVDESCGRGYSRGDRRRIGGGQLGGAAASNSSSAGV